MATDHHDILLFDGICNLCNGFVQFIIRRDPAARFKFASLQSEAGQAALGRLGMPRDVFNSLILIQDEVGYTKSTAVLKTMRDLGGVWKILYVLMIIPRPVRDFFYDLVARSRYRIFGKRDACMIPTPELEARFL